MMNDSASSDERLVLGAVQWARLPFIEEVEPISEKDYDVLRQLREVLVRHGYEERFGVCLLHKHFEVREGEIALEESDENARVSTIRIVADEDCEGAMETAWQFTASTEIHAGWACKFKCRGSGMTNHNKYHSGEKEKV